MKRYSFIFSCLVSLFFSSIYAQIQYVEGSSGVMTLINQEEVSFSNLRIAEDQLYFFNLNSRKEEFVYKQSVKSIQLTDNKPIEIVETKANHVLPTEKKEDIEKKKNERQSLSRKQIIKELEDKKDPLYLSGKSSSSTGNVFLGAGLGLIVGGGIYNLTRSNEVTTTANGYSQQKGSPIPIIIGLAGIAVSIPLKIVGGNKKNKAIEAYRNGLSSVSPKEWQMVYDKNGMGFVFRF